MPRLALCVIAYIFLTVAALNAAVLLIHGLNDTVVPYERSDVIFDSLKGAKKEGEFVTLQHEDRWRTRSETRLQSAVAFLRAHNPPGQRKIGAPTRHVGFSGSASGGCDRSVTLPPPPV
jgi:hypothetical protein